MKQAFALLLMLSTLVIGNQVFAAAPKIKEFGTSSRKFSTVGHSKAKGINMVVAYPQSWLAKEGERPNIVHKFVSEGGRGLEIAVIITRDIPLPYDYVISETELKEFFTPKGMKDMVPPGSKFINAKPTKIDGLPAGILEYSMRHENAGLTLYTQSIAYVFVYGNTMVQFICGVSEGPNTAPEVLRKKMDTFKPLFFLMANSIVVQNRWK